MDNRPRYLERREPTFSKPAGQDYFYGHDHLYSVVCLFDGSGSVAERYE